MKTPIERPIWRPLSVKPIIAPSILSANFARLEEDVLAAVRGGAGALHCDIMDGTFVPNISFGPMVVKTLNEITDVMLDVHLMIVNPDKYIPKFVEAGADLIYPHVEAPFDIYRTVQLIADLGVRPGLTLNPGTPLETVKPLLDHLDTVLIMSVCPGFGGQKFIPSSLDRIRRLREFLDGEKPSVAIAVDGGVSKENIVDLYKAGVRHFIAGSAVFKTDDIEKTVREMRMLVEGLE